MRFFATKRVLLTFMMMPLTAAAATAQQDVPADSPIAHMPITDAHVSGAVAVRSSGLDLSSGVAISAESPVTIALTRGGQVNLCQNSAVHLSKGANAGEVMLALDRGAVEMHATIGPFSDILLTPDLRLLISGPAEEDVRVRASAQGDTCVENRGSNAPYITVTETLGAAVYRLRAGQHVTFEHGSVGQVVDSENEPCGCPPDSPVTDSAGKPAFPLAESEGLVQPAATTTPVAQPGEVHAQVTIPFAYNGNNPPPASTASQPPAAKPAAQTTEQPAPDLATAVKRFFHKLFRKK